MTSPIIRVQLCMTLSPLSMGFYRQEYWSGLPCPLPGDLPDSGIEPASPALQAVFTVESLGKPSPYYSYTLYSENTITSMKQKLG